MADRHAGIVFGIRIGTGNHQVALPGEYSPQSTRHKQCSISKLLEPKRGALKQSSASSWLLPGRVGGAGALHPLPETRDRPLPANWLSQERHRSSGRRYNSKVQPSAGERKDVLVVQPNFDAIEQPKAIPDTSGPYHAAYGVLPYRNIRHKKQVATPTPWNAQSAWKAAENHQEKGKHSPAYDQHQLRSDLYSSTQPVIAPQAANQSIELLYSQEDLTGPIRNPASPSQTPSKLVIFRSIPQAYNCHSSLRRIAWERTLRSALASLSNAQEALQRHKEPEHPWTSPAQLAAMPTLTLFPSAGFHYAVLRYPTGHGFTQRLMYPHSSTNVGLALQHHKSLPAPSPAAAPQEEGSRNSEGHQCLEQERSLQNLQDEGCDSTEVTHDVAQHTSVEALHRLPMESSTEAGGIPRGSVDNVEESSALEADGWCTPTSQGNPENDPRSVTVFSEDLDGLVTDAVYMQEAAHEDVGQDVAGASSLLAGPAPLELHHTQQQNTACTPKGITRNGQQPWGLLNDCLDDPPAVDLPEYQPCIIPTKGFQRRGATVQARVTARADLMYSAQVLVMPNGQTARPLGTRVHARSRGARTKSPPKARSAHSASCETAEAYLDMGEELEDMDVSAWISEWNDRAIWIQRLGDRARRKEVETPLPEALQQAALEDHEKNKVLQWNHHLSNHVGSSGASHSLEGQQSMRTPPLPRLVKSRQCKSARLRLVPVDKCPVVHPPEHLQPELGIGKSSREDGLHTSLGSSFHQRNHTSTSIIPASNSDWMLRYQLHRHTAPAAGHQGSPTEGHRSHGGNATTPFPVPEVLDLPCKAIQQQVQTSRPAMKARASPGADLRPMSGRWSSGQVAAANSTVTQGPLIRFDVDSKNTELRELRQASSLDACDMMSEVSHSNKHGSISLAGSALGCDDVGSSVHHGSIPVCMHGDTECGGGDLEGEQPRVGARAGSKARSGAKQGTGGQRERLLLQYDAGLRMAMALQAESHGGLLPQIAVRGSVKLKKSKGAFVTDSLDHIRQAAWRKT